MTRVRPGGSLRASIITGLAETAQFVLPPDELMRQLHEYDPAMLDLLVDQAYWDRIGDAGETDTARERQQMVKASRRAWRSSPLDQWVKWTWTAEGLGQGIDVATDDAAAQERWDEFWKAERNAALLGDDKIHELSFDLLNDGNLFLSFYSSPADGETTIREIDTEEITDIITDPSDRSKNWFYKREYVARRGILSDQQALYYPDWALFFDPDELERAWTLVQENNLVPQNAQRADLVQQDTDLGEAAATSVCVLHIAHNCKERSSPWGWPLDTVSMPYQRAHKQFIQATLSKVLSVAQFVRRSRVEGGSRAVNSVLDTVRSTLSQSNRIETNPPPVPGASWHVENAAVRTEELPLTTAAMDTDRDNKTLAWAALLGGGLFPATAGLDVARYATALTMDRVQSFIFSKYQTFWSSQFRTMFKIVMGFAGMSMEIEVEISIDSYGLPDFPEMVTPTATLMQQITTAVTAGIVAPDNARALFAALLRPAMQAIGASNIAELLTFAAAQAPSPQQATQRNQQADRELQGQAEMLRLAAGHYERGEIELEALMDAVVATYTEGGKGSGWFGPDKGGTHGKGSQSRKSVAEKMIRSTPEMREVAEGLIKGAAEAAGVEPDVMKAELDRHFKAALRDSNVSIRTPAITAQAIAEDGEFQNQHQSGTSRGYLDNEWRATVENRAFNIGEDDGSQFPIYGYVTGPYEDAGKQENHYGPIEWVLKDSVMDRTTVTVGDSLEGGLGEKLIPSPARNPTHTCLGVYTTDYAKGVFFGQGQEGGRFRGSVIPYYEAQIHGGVKTSDVDRIRIHVWNEEDANRWVPQALGLYRASGLDVEFITVGGFVIPLDTSED